MQFAATVGVLAWLGYRLDLAIETFPLFLIVGVFAGFAGGLFSLIKKVPPASKRNSASFVPPDRPLAGRGEPDGSSERDGS